MIKHNVFVTGGSGYIGRPLIRELLARGHSVRALVRSASASKVPAGAQIVTGDALSAASVRAALGKADTLVHLVGTSHPNPSKARQFREVDLASIRASASAAANSTVKHFIYVSVAHPAPVMRSFIAARTEGEELVLASGISATILRPWYVLGPGHWWPYLLVPLYKVLEILPWTTESAHRLGLVSLAQMVAALVLAVEDPAQQAKIIEVPAIRKSRLTPAGG